MLCSPHPRPSRPALAAPCLLASPPPSTLPAVCTAILMPALLPACLPATCMVCSSASCLGAGMAGWHVAVGACQAQCGTAACCAGSSGLPLPALRGPPTSTAAALVLSGVSLACTAQRQPSAVAEGTLAGRVGCWPVLLVARRASLSRRMKRPAKRLRPMLSDACCARCVPGAACSALSRAPRGGLRATPLAVVPPAFTPPDAYPPPQRLANLAAADGASNTGRVPLQRRHRPPLWVAGRAGRTGQPPSPSPGASASHSPALSPSEPAHFSHPVLPLKRGEVQAAVWCAACAVRFSPLRARLRAHPLPLPAHRTRTDQL